MESLEDRLAPATFTVRNAADSGTDSLRWAITRANAAAGADRIEFAIPGAGVHTVGVLTALPAVTGRLTIAGHTQPGFVAGAPPLIEVNGVATGAGVNGLVLNASGSVVRGLTINRFDGDGIRITGSNCTVTGCFIGTANTGNAPAGNGGNGILIRAGADNNTIGGTTPGSDNLIGANSKAGVRIQGAGTTGNRVQGNVIGLRLDDLGPLGNGVGVWVAGGATGNLIGGAAGNTLSGNAGGGVVVSGVGTMNNTIANNQIGINHAGTATRPNNSDGILVSGGARSITIANNIISGNLGNGVQLHGAGVEANVVRGNTIGLNPAGIIMWGNTLSGVLVSSEASRNRIGGTLEAHRNEISGNGMNGIQIESGGCVGNVILGNYIGTSASGIGDRGNTGHGVLLVGGPRNTVIGGTVAGSRNVISGNEGYGILMVGAGTRDNRIQGNYIGLASDGTLDLGNSSSGVYVSGGANSNVVGGAVPRARNVISGNELNGVSMAGAGTTGNRVLGNFIGTDAAGTLDRGNTNAGVQIFLGATSNTVGGTVAGARNVISGNNTDGLVIANTGTTGNRVLGNFIGTTRTGVGGLGNEENGVRIFGNASNNVIGGAVAGARNVITGNHFNGVVVSDAGTNGNRIQGNYVGLPVTGSGGPGNGGQGVRIVAGATNTVIGGTSAGARNVIASNLDAGIFVGGAGTTGTRVLGNYIGTDASGLHELDNAGAGVVISSAATDTVIGGTVAGAGNLISGNHTYGVMIMGTGTSANRILGNVIGLNAARAPLGNVRSGVFITDGATDNAVGGREAGSRNIIASNGGDGVLIGSDPFEGFAVLAGFGNEVLRNQIFSNGGLGIDLGENDGTTFNDPDDTDTGPNQLMNFPIITTALIDGNSILISGVIVTHAISQLRIEFFVSGIADGSGFGEGQRFLGSIDLNTGTDLETGFSATFTLPPGSGARIITATATDIVGNTSEFSFAKTAV